MPEKWEESIGTAWKRLHLNWKNSKNGKHWTLEKSPMPENTPFENCRNTQKTGEGF